MALTARHTWMAEVAAMAFVLDCGNDAEVMKQSIKSDSFWFSTAHFFQQLGCKPFELILCSTKHLYYNATTFSNVQGNSIKVLMIEMNSLHILNNSRSFSIFANHPKNVTAIELIWSNCHQFRIILSKHFVKIAAKIMKSYHINWNVITS